MKMLVGSTARANKITSGWILVVAKQIVAPVVVV
jgi:hypothetical protein